MQNVNGQKYPACFPGPRAIVLGGFSAELCQFYSVGGGGGCWKCAFCVVSVCVDYPLLLISDLFFFFFFHE